MVEQLNPHRLSEYPKALSDELNEWFWERVRSGLSG
jgi:hypothetical protein